MEEFVRIFEGEIDVMGTLSLHSDVFQELLDYFHTHVKPYTVQFSESDQIWVPIDYLKVIFGGDKNFRTRLNRFVKGLASNHFREEDHDIVMEFGLGPIGNSFLSCEMTYVLFLNENKLHGKEAKTLTGDKGKGKEACFVQDNEDEEVEVLPSDVEASLALMMFQGGEEESAETMLEGDHVTAEIPEVDITCLNPIIIDGAEYLLLDDISKSVGLREDEALCILGDIAGKQEGNRIEIEYENETETKKLEYISYEGQRSLEETVALALVDIQNAAPEYELIPESAFLPHQPLVVADAKDDKGSIDIMRPELVAGDEDTKVIFNVFYNLKQMSMQYLI